MPVLVIISGWGIGIGIGMEFVVDELSPDLITSKDTADSTRTSTNDS